MRSLPNPGDAIIMKRIFSVPIWGIQDLGSDKNPAKFVVWGYFFRWTGGHLSHIRKYLEKVMMFLWYLVWKLNITMYPPYFASFQHTVLQAHASVVITYVQIVVRCVMPFPSSQIGFVLVCFLGFAWAPSKDIRKDTARWLKHIIIAYHWSLY